MLALHIMTKLLTPEKIMEIGTSFLSSKVLLTAIELDLFTKLGDKALTADEISKLLNLQYCRGLFDFLDALLALEFLERNGDGSEGKYQNTPETKTFLDKNMPSYIGGILEMFNSRIYGFFNDLSEALKTGKPQSEAKHGGQLIFEAIYSDEDRLFEFLNGMNGLQLANFTILAEKFDFSKYKALADIGGGLGLLSILVAKHHKNLTCISLDLPEVTAFTKDYISNAGVLDRVKAAEIDIFSQPFPKADVITMGNILHDWNLEKKKILIKKAYEALPEGGAFIAIENIIDDARRKNIDGMLLSLIMLIEFGDAFDYTEKEFREWCTEAGFKRFDKIKLSGSASALVAYK